MKCSLCVLHVNSNFASCCCFMGNSELKLSFQFTLVVIAFCYVRCSGFFFFKLSCTADCSKLMFLTVWLTNNLVCGCVWCSLCGLDSLPARCPMCLSPWLRISLGFFKQPARPSCRDWNTQEVPGKVDRQDYGQRQQANHGHEQDDVALEGQVRDGVDATFAAYLFVPAENREGETFRIFRNCWNCYVIKNTKMLQMIQRWNLHKGRLWWK